MLCIRHYSTQSSAEDEKPRGRWEFGKILDKNNFQKVRDPITGAIEKDDEGNEKNKYEKCGQLNLAKVCVKILVI